MEMIANEFTVYAESFFAVNLRPEKEK